MMTENNANWHHKRLGKFTSSEFHKLIGNSNSIPPGGITYIAQKAAELMTMDIKNEIFSKSIEWGYDHERDACLLFEKKLQISGIYYGKYNPQFFEYKTDAGGSPDWEAIIDSGEGIIIGADFKCPYNSSEHLINLGISNSVELEMKRFEYWVQLQCNIKFRKWDHAYFVSYDPRFIEDCMKMKIIKVKKDTLFSEKIDSILNRAIRYRDYLIDNLQNTNNEKGIFIDVH